MTHDHRTAKPVLRAVFALAISLAAAGVWAQQQITLTVLFTSDVHGRVLPTDDVRQKPAKGSLAQVSSLVNRVRQENPNTLVFDGGDAIQGTPMAYYALLGRSPDGIDPTIAAMNLIGYDAAVIGNHEFNFGLDALRRSLGQARFPWLAANLSGMTSAKLPVGDEVILNRSGLRIGIIGLTNPNIPNWEAPRNFKGLTFTNPETAARERVARLRSKVDVLIVLLHSGLERDVATGASKGSEPENFAWRIAQIEGIDLLLFGHVHADIPPQKIGNAIVAEPGRWAELVSRIDLTVEKGESAAKIIAWQGRNLATAGEIADEKITAALEKTHAWVTQELARPLTQLTTSHVVDSLPTADDPLIDLVHAVQLQVSGATLSLAAPLGISRTEFPAGTITPRFVHAIYQYPNSLVVVKLTGEQLKDILEYASRGWTGIDCESKPGCNLIRDPDVPPYDFDTVAGATYLVDVKKPLGHRITGLRINGKSVTPGQTFTLVTNSYRAFGGGHYPHLAQAPRVKEINRPIPELIIDYLARQQKLTLKADDNWAFLTPLRTITAPRPNTSNP